jgi:hypothetical protein
MSAYLERESNTIYFLTDARRHKDEEIARNPAINLSFADASAQKYVSLTGTAVVSNDRAKIKELFHDNRESVVGKRRRSEHPRPESHARRCGILGFAGHYCLIREDGRRRRHRHAARYRRKPQDLNVNLTTRGDCQEAACDH